MSELSVAVEEWRGALSHAITNRHTKIVSMVGHMTQVGSCDDHMTLLLLSGDRPAL